MNNTESAYQLPDWVLINPDLQSDPENKQGELGIITAAIVGQDEFYVGFDDKVVGLYSADTLLVLEDRENIYEYLTENRMELGKSDFTALLNIVLFQSYGGPDHQKQALTLALKHPIIREFALVSLDSQIRNFSQTQRPGR